MTTSKDREQFVGFLQANPEIKEWLDSLPRGRRMGLPSGKSHPRQK